MSRPEAASVPVPEHDEGDHLLGEQEDEYGDEEADYEQFRQWMQFRERGRRREQRGPRSRDQSRRGREDEDDDNGDLRANAGPPPPWDGQESPFEDYLIRARIWVGTTKARGRTRGPLLLKALSGTPFQDFKHLAKDTKWLTDPDNAETLLSQMDTPEYYGDDKDEHLLASLSRITYHLKRSRNESARQFLGRWEAAERKVLEHKVNLPSIYKGFLLINALGLSEADTKALLNFTQGSIEPKDVKHWLRKHETKLQANQLGNEVSTKLGKPTGTAIHLVEDQSEENTEVAPEGAEETELEMMEAMLADLVEPEEPETGPFEEQEAAEILAMMIKEKKKTYSQSAQLKKDKELGRGYRSGGGFNRANNGPIRPGTYKLSIAELKQRTRCQKCGRIGHWKRECPGTASASSTMPPKETHLLEVDLQDYDDAMFCHLLETIPEKITSTNAVLTEEFEPKGCGEHPDRTDSPISELDYMSCRFHEVWFSDHTGYDDRACATLDTGCQRTAVGIETLNQMKPLWPHELKWFKQEETNRFRSVHGVSQTTYNAVLPCSLGKKGCYLKPAVFEGPQSSQAPFLLSLKFLLQSDAIISLVQGRLMLVLSKHGAHIPLHLGPTGALRVQLNDFSRVMLSALRKAEGRLHSSGSNEFDILALGELKDPPRERELSVVNQASDGARTARALDAWRNLLLRLCVIFRPVVRMMVNLVEGSLDRSYQQVKNNVHAYHLASLEELRRVVDEAIKDKSDRDKELFHKFQNWKREKKVKEETRTESGFEMVDKPAPSSAPSWPDSISDYTHYNIKTGSRGRRMTSSMAEGICGKHNSPRGPPPPTPVRRNKMTTTTSEESSHYPAQSSSSTPVIEKVTDKMKQQEIFTFGAQLFGIELPVCQCNLVCKMELRQTSANYLRVFTNCCRRTEKEQCGAFQWCSKQPLLDEEFLATRERIRAELKEDHTPREFLVRMIQDLCGHSSTVRTGSNAFVNRVRCRTCNKLLTVENKNPKKETTTSTAKSGTAPMEASDESTSHNEDYQEFLAWRRQQH
ncbi:unnamed protein product [Symbiodinium microadriaticum]|nr:unnamed protein product [Symbiodinium microadriaticum]